MKKILEAYYNENNDYEICIDEAGRGCAFGRVYIASVILPKDLKNFDGSNIKDSKKFTSKQKLKLVAEYIKENVLEYNISYIESTVIDEINILQAVMKGMKICINNNIEKLKKKDILMRKKVELIIDGNYFKPSYTYYSEESNSIVGVPHVTIEKGDGKYMGIAAASILAKDARDTYILELCEKNPILSENYTLEKNMGYCTKKHIEGIECHGITEWHRKTYSCCKNKKINIIE
tara:strand:+ start:372 stop:1073 length:702 start_codon:yes stop_codon:yes gene_type:complete